MQYKTNQHICGQEVEDGQPIDNRVQLAFLNLVVALRVMCSIGHRRQTVTLLLYVPMAAYL